MRTPGWRRPEFKRIGWLYLCIFLAHVVRDGVTMLRESRFHYTAGDGWLPSERHWAWPRWMLSSRACDAPIPAWMQVDDYLAIERNSHPRPRAAAFCLSESKVERKRQLQQLELLLAFMRAEVHRMGGIGLAAGSVGVPLRILWFKDHAMLNPRLVSESVQTLQCTVREAPTQPPRKVRHPKYLRTEYETENGVLKTMDLAWDEACVMYALIHKQ
jgi:hypothetical protein